MTKVYHARGWSDYSNWIPNRQLVQTVEEADIVFFEGGTDIGPGRYGDKTGNWTDSPDHKRDEDEIALFKKAVALGKYILGSCRGAQLIGVMNHAKLIQHQNNPGGIHLIKTYDGKDIHVTSSHHQAVNLSTLTEGVDYKLLGWSDGLIKFRYNGDNNEVEVERDSEIVYYPKTKALAMQQHNEWMFGDKTFEEDMKWHIELFNKFINNEL